ncbi:hypothetical protein BCHO_0066 [Bifidobacterium choerinum]|uniref:Uncharacterized protein n=1 Tax=Bifidobacterium choerinum TaxID=35760 RepID=A0A087AGT6_9BIFI|nr:hypothetical protein BCHO_0066 [Bifidobacterium choerinum]
MRRAEFEAVVDAVDRRVGTFEMQPRPRIAVVERLRIVHARGEGADRHRIVLRDGLPLELHDVVVGGRDVVEGHLDAEAHARRMFRLRDVPADLHRLLVRVGHVVGRCDRRVFGQRRLLRLRFLDVRDVPGAGVLAVPAVRATHVPRLHDVALRVDVAGVELLHRDAADAGQLVGIERVAW